MTAVYQRLLPRLMEDNKFFWTSGADGKLRFLRCQDCGYFIHPPAPICPACLSAKLAPEAISGKGVVKTFTVNHQKWGPGLEQPYVIAVVSFPEQSDLQFTTNLINIAPDAVRIGQPVQVVFEKDEDCWIPLFEPSA